jgi:hypothetical protein
LIVFELKVDAAFFCCTSDIAFAGMALYKIWVTDRY